MRRGLKSHNYKITKLQNGQRGYILITLMLIVALAAIAMLAVLPRMEQQIQRDREEELQHRGTAYMRAIQHYYRKFGRYPSRIEELENTNNLRFLRKRYKDPITGKDFKLLHMQDVNLSNGPVLGGGLGPNLPSPQGKPFGPGLNQLGGGGQFGNQPSPTPPQNNPDNGEGDNPVNTPSPVAGGSTPGGAPGQASPDAGSDNSGGGNPSPPPVANAGPLSSPGGGLGGQVFGGGPILGVASTSKDKSIREFDKKDHYKDWLFIYVAQMDRGGLLVGPYQTNLAGGLGGSGIGQPVQNLAQPPQGNQPTPFGGLQGVQPNQPNQPQNPSGDSNNQ